MESFEVPDAASKTAKVSVAGGIVCSEHTVQQPVSDDSEVEVTNDDIDSLLLEMGASRSAASGISLPAGALPVGAGNVRKLKVPKVVWEVLASYRSKLDAAVDEVRRLKLQQEELQGAVQVLQEEKQQLASEGSEYKEEMCRLRDDYTVMLNKLLQAACAGASVAHADEAVHVQGDVRCRGYRMNGKKWGRWETVNKKQEVVGAVGWVDDVKHGEEVQGVRSSKKKLVWNRKGKEDGWYRFEQRHVQAGGGVDVEEGILRKGSRTSCSKKYVQLNDVI